MRAVAALRSPGRLWTGRLLRHRIDRRDSGCSAHTSSSRRVASRHVRQFQHLRAASRSAEASAAFAETILGGYAVSVLRRVISTITLLGLASAPVVGRTRLLCRYTGVEITDCAEQDVPGHSVLRTEGCCDRQMTQPLAATIGAERYELGSPLVCALPTSVVADAPVIAFAVVANASLAAPPGPPVLLITRALLI
jgi:hypothetical protein